MEVFYYLVFGVLGLVVAALELSKNNKDRINTPSAFNSFKNNYVLVYSLMMVSFLSGSAADDGTRRATIIKVSVISGVILICLAILGWVGYKFVFKKNNRKSQTDSETASKILVSGAIPMEVLRKATNDFSKILGRGGFGVVYAGEFPNRTKTAVKKMECAGMSDKGMKQFQSEVGVLTKVRHKNLVNLLGYCVNGNERLLAYEYMPQGNLGQHLFGWRELGYSSLTWKQRVRIALDVARGVEYLHFFAPKSYIHRDLKSSNILLGDDMRAKVSDFGLVKNATADGKYSADLQLSGTLGYLAPEYAGTGMSSTKVDVYAFGVILMELITGRKAFEKNHGSEEPFHLVSWFSSIVINKESIPMALDQRLELSCDEETTKSLHKVAELAGLCTAHKPDQRPEMDYVVNMLVQLVEKWQPPCQEEEEQEEGEEEEEEEEEEVVDDAWWGAGVRKSKKSKEE